MEWGLEVLEGMALAAWLKPAPAAEASPVALPANERASLDRILGEWRGLPTDARLERLRRVASRLRPPLDAGRAEEALPARALALLASEVPLEHGERWSRRAPTPRPGYRPDPDLVQHLRDAFRRSEEERWPG